MGIADYIIIAVIALILGLAAGYVYKAKKSGKKCIGCPYSGSCSSCKGSCSCAKAQNEQEDDQIK